MLQMRKKSKNPMHSNKINHNLKLIAIQTCVNLYSFIHFDSMNFCVSAYENVGMHVIAHIFTRSFCCLIIFFFFLFNSFLRICRPLQAENDFVIYEFNRWNGFCLLECCCFYSHFNTEHYLMLWYMCECVCVCSGKYVKH